MDALWKALEAQLEAKADPIAIGVIALLGYAGMWLVNRVRLASLDAAMQVELKAKAAKAAGVSLGVDKLTEAVSLTQTELGKLGIIVTPSAIKSFIHRQLPRVRKTVESMYPPSIDPRAGTLLAVPPRSRTGFSGDKFPAVNPRQSGEIESWGAMDLPKADATLDDGGEQ